MADIKLTAEQADQLRQVLDGVAFSDPSGRCLGYFVLEMTGEEIEEALRRSKLPGKRYTTEEVLRHLDSLSD